MEERARSFGKVASKYDRARPHYPAALVTDLTSGRRVRVLDVGCGTGIAARPFVDAGCEVQGVEHDPGMAEVARAHGLAVDVARFEDWHSPGAVFDLVMSGQAWHWIDPVEGPCVAADSLLPTGHLAIYWIEYRHQPDVEQVFAQVYGELAAGLLHSSHPLGMLTDGEHSVALAASYVNALAASDRFQPAVVRHYDDTRTYRTQDWVDGLPTHSDHQVLAQAKSERLFATLSRELDALGGTITVGLRTHLVLAQRA